MKPTFKESFMLLLLVLAIAEALPEDKIKYANLDEDALCKNTRLMENHLKCIKNLGPCTAEGRDMKDRIPPALNNGCSDCNEAEKKRAKKLANCVRCHYAKHWDEIMKVYDPESKLREEMEEFFGPPSCEGKDH